MPLKPIDKKKNPGLAKLPTGVRNKMGYMKKGGAVKKKDGGMVLEIGLRPATEKEMKMAKEMEPKKKANGGMVRGTGAAISGKGFKGSILMAEDKDKKTSLKEKIGLFIDKKLTFGGGLSTPQKIIDMAEEAVGVESYKDIDTQEKFNQFKKIMNEMSTKYKDGVPKEAKNGGMIKKFKKGGSVEGKRLTRTVPLKKGPNSQGMRGTGAAIRGTKFKGVF